jgi:hypothetical protein
MAGSRGRSQIRDRLQPIEDEFAASGVDEVIAACDADTWIGRTIARTRDEHGEGPPPAGDARLQPPLPPRST